MKKTFSTVLTLAAAGVLLLHTPRVSAQDDAPPPPPAGAPAGAPGQGGPGGGPGGRGGDWQQRRAEMLKTALKASDDEWTVIQPLVEKVVTKQREAGGGMMGGPGGPGGRGQRGNGGPGGPGGPGGGPRQQAENGGGNRPGRPGASPEAQALSEALQKDPGTTEEIKSKLAALREQRKKSAVELTQAREELKKVLNLRQEATLVSMGILD